MPGRRFRIDCRGLAQRETVRPNSYDELPYGSTAIPEMHPNRMAVVGRLFGLDPAPVRTCRVLDIGCAEGGNAIPVAVSLPEARVVGIDLSERQVAIGNERISALGLGNVELVRADLSELKGELGTFDYVCAHGVYSWVAPDVQETLLGACRSLLSPGGVAYVSYNTQPGWSPRLVLRELALLGARRQSGAARKVAAARRLVAVLAAPPAQRGADDYRTLLAREWSRVGDKPDEYVFHEFLAEENRPCWFHELVARAAAAGLTYVADARFGATAVAAALPELVSALEGIARDRVEREQYVDLLGFRTFRQSLFCRSERRPTAEPDPSVLDGLHVVSLVPPPVAPVDLRAKGSVGLAGADGTNLETDDPVLKACLAQLWERYPEAVPFAGLALSLAVPGAGGGEDGLRVLRQALLKGWAGRFVDLLEHVPAYVPRPGERPAASPLARLQASRGGGSATSLLHRDLRLDDLESLVLSLLDGTRDVAALSRETAEAVSATGLLRDADGNAVRDEERVRAFVGRAVGPILDDLARAAFLTA